MLAEAGLPIEQRALGALHDDRHDRDQRERHQGSERRQSDVEHALREPVVRSGVDVQRAHEPRAGDVAHRDATECVLEELGGLDHAESEGGAVEQVSERGRAVTVERDYNDVRTLALDRRWEVINGPQEQGRVGHLVGAVTVIDEADDVEGRRPIEIEFPHNIARDRGVPDQEDTTAGREEAPIQGLPAEET